MAAPESVEWSRLSPASKETLKHVVVRLAAGYTYDEIAAQLQVAQPELRHLPPPPNGRFSKHWVTARGRELRAEIEQRGAATY